MKNKLIEIGKEEKEVRDVLDLIAGCDSATMTYGVDKNYNVTKVVSFFVRTPYSIHEFEDLGAAHTRVLATNPSMSLLKQYDFKVEGRKIKRCCRDYVKVLLRTLSGFVKDKETYDMRHKYEQKRN